MQTAKKTEEKSYADALKQERSAPAHTRLRHPPYASDLGDGGLLSRREEVGKVALATVLTVVVPSHKDTSTALGRGALATKALEGSVGVDLVVLEDCHLDLLPLVLDLLGGSVLLLLPLLGSSTQAKHEVQGRLLLDVVVRKGATVLELLAGEDQALLVRGDTGCAEGVNGSGYAEER